MTIDINRKITFLDKDFALSTADVESKLDGIGKSSLAGKSALQFQKFRAAALTLVHFRDQQNGALAEDAQAVSAAANAPAVSAKDAEAAWKTLSSISKSLSDKVLSDRLNVSLSRPEENGVLNAYTSMAVEFSKMFSLEAKQEAQLRSVPADASFTLTPAVETGYFRPNEAIPFLENIEKTAPTDMMERLARSPVFKLHPELEFGRFQNAVEYLSEYGRKPSAGLNAGAANAFQDFREHGNTVIGQIDTMLAGMTDTNPEYEALRDYRAVLMQYDHAVASTDAFEQRRMFRAEQKHFEDVRAEAAAFFAPADHEAILEEDFEEMEDDEPSAARQHFVDVRAEVSYYRQHVHETAFELQYPALERQIAEKSAEIPYEVRSAFRDINSLEDLCRMQEQAKIQMEKHRPGDDTPAGQYPEYVQQIIELRTLEMKKAVLAEANPAQYRQYAERTAEQMERLPDAATRNRVKSLAEQLNAMHKFGRNTEEYRLFRDALNDAAENGDYRKLHDLAQDYVMKKTAGGKSPTSANGVARLSVAHAVLDLLDRTAENQILASLPTEEEEEEMEAASERDSAPADISLGSVLFSNLHAEEQPAPGEAEQDSFDEASEEEEQDAPEEEQDAPEQEQPAEEHPAQPEAGRAPIPSSQEISREEAMKSTDPIAEAMDELNWKPVRPGVRSNKEQFHEWIERDLYSLPPELRETEVKKVYELVNRHLTGKDINGPVNFMRAMKQELFEGRNGQPPLLDPGKHRFYLLNITEAVWQNSDLAERQAALYRKMKAEGPEGFRPMADTPLIPETQLENPLARAQAARDHILEKMQQAALERVFGYFPDDELDYYHEDEIPVNANFCAQLGKAVMLGNEKTAAAVTHLTTPYLYALYRHSNEAEPVFVKEVGEALARSAQAAAAAPQGNRRPADPQGPVRD